MRYVAGFDGGGTKTAVTVADEHGRVCHTFTSGGMNYNGQDEASIRNSITDMMQKMGELTGGLQHCAHICIGAAGVSNPAVQERLTESVRASGYQGGIIITGDHVTALYGAHEGDPGMIVIAGTGSICYGLNAQGDNHRTGGFGHIIDDEGSGYSIGRAILSAVVQAYDGRIQPTVMTAMVFDQLQLDNVQQLIGFVYDPQRSKKDIAALGPILTEACLLSDSAAQEIARASAASLCKLVIPVAERLDLQQGVVAMGGSVLTASQPIRAAFVEQLMQQLPSVTCIPPRKNASIGAMLLAKRELLSSKR